MTSMVELESVNGAVGRATPKRTGEIKLSAISHNSSTASFIKAWNTLLHFPNGVVGGLGLHKTTTEITL